MSSQLARRLTEQLGYPLLDEETIEDFIIAHEFSVLFFSERPAQFPESDDVAVVLPELVKSFAGRLSPAVIALESQRRLQSRYGFTTWPALVFLRRGKYLGAITGIQNWDTYQQEITRLLASTPSQTPIFPLPLVSEPTSHCH